MSVARQSANCGTNAVVDSKHALGRLRSNTGGSKCGVRALPGERLMASIQA